MAIVCNGGSAAMEFMLYGDRDPHLVDYLSKMNQQAERYLTHTAKAAVDRYRTTVDRFYNSDAVRLARAALRKVDSIGQIDAIYLLDSIGKLQHAPSSMIPYIMAEPTLRAMYHRQRVDGYGEDYYDYQPDKCGEGHTEYERATDGLFLIEDDVAVSTSYLHIDAGQSLTFDQQIEIQGTWEQIKIALARGVEDPTSRFNNTLK